jgi:hypothetical protein
METKRVTVEEMANELPHLAKDMKERGFVASVSCVSPRTLCMWYETVKGGRVLVYGSKALFERAGREGK